MYRMLFGAVVFVAACGSDGELDNPFQGPCEEYCVQRNVCDEDVVVEDCRQECVDASQDCQADEQDQALEEIDACAEESCDEIAACTIGAGLQCWLGI